MDTKRQRAYEKSTFVATEDNMFKRYYQYCKRRSLRRADHSSRGGHSPRRAAEEKEEKKEEEKKKKKKDNNNFVGCLNILPVGARPAVLNFFYDSN
jgi:hypothetical protein